MCFVRQINVSNAFSHWFFVSILDRKVSTARGLMCDAHSPKCYVLGWCDSGGGGGVCIPFYFHSVEFSLCVWLWSIIIIVIVTIIIAIICAVVAVLSPKGTNIRLTVSNYKPSTQNYEWIDAKKSRLKKKFRAFCVIFLLLLFSIWYLTCCTLAMSTSFSQRACLTLWNALSRLKKKQRDIRISIINSTRATKKNKMKAIIGIEKSNKQPTTKKKIHSN